MRIITVIQKPSEYLQKRYDQSKVGDFTNSIFPFQVCTAAPGVDSCLGDSGGPVVMQLGTLWYQVSGCSLCSPITCFKNHFWLIFLHMLVWKWLFSGSMLLVVFTDFDTALRRKSLFLRMKQILLFSVLFCKNHNFYLSARHRLVWRKVCSAWISGCQHQRCRIYLMDT